MNTTRERILDEAEYLFARGGIAGVATREIVRAAEQRNTSAVTYHFGSREGLLLALLARRGGPIDARRGELRTALGVEPSVVELLRCLVEPYCDMLRTDEGCSYLRIVAQLRGQFASWRIDSDTETTRCLALIIDEIEAASHAQPAERRQRTVGMMMVMTGLVAERARVADEGDGAGQLELPHDEFVAVVTDMCANLVMSAT